jgi:hypothetical protein
MYHLYLALPGERSVHHHLIVPVYVCRPVPETNQRLIDERLESKVPPHAMRDGVWQHEISAECAICYLEIIIWVSPTSQATFVRRIKHSAMVKVRCICYEVLALAYIMVLLLLLRTDCPVPVWLCSFWDLSIVLPRKQRWLSVPRYPHFSFIVVSNARIYSRCHGKKKPV